MRYEPEKIEEKMIPFIEGVLNPREHREVEEALRSNSQLAREVTDLREVIDGLREGFASGVKPPQEKLSVEEVVELGSGEGGVETLRGTSEQKARLFCSDDAMEELALLRALQDEMARTTLDIDNVPPMPDSLRAEFQRLNAGSPKVVPLVRKLSPVPLWRRASQFLDRIDPKPLMASAAALMMLSLGVHFTQSKSHSPASPQVASAYTESADNSEFGKAEPTPIATSAAEGGEAASTDEKPAARDKSREPSGVSVFTSDDRRLLNEQSGKLLERKVRYTMTDDRILVAEKDVKTARDILWGDDEGTELDEEMESRFIRRSNKGSEDPDLERELEAVAKARPRRSAKREAVNVKSSITTDGYRQKSTPYPSAKQPMVRTRKGSKVVNGYSSGASKAAPRPAAKPRRMKEIKAFTRPKSRAKKTSSAPRKGVGDYRNSALKPKQSAVSNSPGGRVVDQTTQVDQPTRQDLAGKDDQIQPIGQSSMQTPAEPPINTKRRDKLRAMAKGESTKVKAPVIEEVEDGDWKMPEPETAPVVTQKRTRAQVLTPDDGVVVSAPVPNAITFENKNSQNQRLARRPSPTMSTGSKAGAAPPPSAGPSQDGRLASVVASKAQVAKRHNVEISVEGGSAGLTVYVRPKAELSKAELDTLRAALRRELNLTDADTIIFR